MADHIDEGLPDVMLTSASLLVRIATLEQALLATVAVLPGCVACGEPATLLGQSRGFPRVYACDAHARLLSDNPEVPYAFAIRLARSLPQEPEKKHTT